MSTIRSFIRKIAFTAFAITAMSASADDLAVPDPFQKFSDPEKAVLAIQTAFHVDGGHVRIVVYDKDEVFLEKPVAKFDAPLDETGLALLPLESLATQDYAFVVYLDENKDGRLNRNFLGRPKEPYMFSNGVKPTLRKPTFDEAKVTVTPGKVVVVTIDK